MVKFSNVVLLSLLLALAAYAKGPEAPALEDISSSVYADPILSPWGLDIVNWTEVGLAPSPIGRSASGILGNYMYNFGCETGNFAQAFNLTTEQWEASTPAPLPMDNWCGVAVPRDNCLYVVGRYNAGYFADIQKFTPTAGGPTGTWTTVAPYPIAFCGGAAAWDGDDYIYAAGGNPAAANTAAYRYSISLNSWTALPAMPIGRAYCGGAYVQGKFYVLGGTVAAAANTMVAYDPISNSWSQVANLPQNVWFSTFSTTFNDGYVMSIGGGGGYGSWPATNAVSLYDPATNTWTQETPLPVARGVNSARWAGAGKVISAGGYTGAYSGVTYRGLEFPGGWDPLAPAAPSNFTIANNGLALMASLSWTNPTLTNNGQVLASIDSIVVKRGTTIVASLFGNPGQAMNYNDNVPSAGSYSYTVYCVNSYGNGATASGSAWIGLDTPGPPRDVLATSPAQLQAIVTWNAPTAGAHGGYWPPGSWTGQKIYRNGNLIATLLGTNTSYNDVLLYTGDYTYGVAYYNASGDGPTVNAPTINVPGPPQYVATAIPYNWVEINPAYPGSLPGTTAGLNADDQNVGPFPIGFNFPFYGGATFSSIRMCSNGWASFTSTATVYVNVVIPTAAEPNNLLAVYWDDLNMNPVGSYGTGWYYYDAPNNRFIAEWDSVAAFGSTITGEYFTFEIILHSDGTIDYMYKAIVLGTQPTPSATVGIENAAGTVGVQCTYNNSGPLEPVSQYGIHFGPPITVPNVTVILLPVNPPIIIPPQGGPFDWDITLHNGEATPQTFDVWTTITLPSGGIRPGWGPYLNLTMAAGQTINRIRTQNISDRYPPGAYTYTAKVGVHPNTVWDSDSFPWTKAAAGEDGWANGETSTRLIPTEYAMYGATPNPFNPTTTLGYALPQAGQVKLTVYNVSGQQVATLVNGWRDAGIHEVTFDASGLASGLYVYQLTAGEFHAIGKMVMTK